MLEAFEDVSPPPIPIDGKMEKRKSGTFVLIICALTSTMAEFCVRPSIVPSLGCNVRIGRCMPTRVPILRPHADQGIWGLDRPSTRSRGQGTPSSRRGVLRGGCGRIQTRAQGLDFSAHAREVHAMDSHDAVAANTALLLFACVLFSQCTASGKTMITQAPTAKLPSAHAPNHA